MISCLLVAVALWMGRDARQLLIGSAALPEEREALERAIEEFDEVDAVKELLTMVLGRNALTVGPNRPSRRPRRRSSRAGLDRDRPSAARGGPGRDRGLSRRHAGARVRVGSSEEGRSRSRWVRCERLRSSGRFLLRAERQKAGIRRAARSSSGGQHDQAEVSSRPGGTPQGKMSQSSCLANEVGEQSVHPLGPMDASL